MDISSRAREVILATIQNKGLTEKQCATDCGLSSGFFADWKAGRVKSPSFDKIYKICKYLEMSIDSLNTESSFTVSSSQNSFDVSMDEQRLIEKYRALDDDGKDIVRSAAISEYRRVIAERGTGTAKIG